MANNKQREYLTSSLPHSAGMNTADAAELMDSVIDQARHRQHLQDEPVVTKSQDAFSSLETNE